MFCDSLSLPTTVVLDISLFCPRMFCCDVVFQDLSKCHTGLGILDLLQFLFTRFPTSSNNSLASLEYLEYLIRSLWTWKCSSNEKVSEIQPLIAEQRDNIQHIVGKILTDEPFAALMSRFAEASWPTSSAGNFFKKISFGNFHLLWQWGACWSK